MSKSKPCHICGSCDTKTVNYRRDHYRCEDCAACSARVRPRPEIPVGSIITTSKGDEIMHIGSGLGVNLNIGK